ncbi:hypothetical protein BV20DRAFT_376017 [Pilatotrama ljubarskyi]|nr:hypothetical protein BV20DRAFT_376017 [Pilatotrama ljubarskyi]
MYIPRAPHMYSHAHSCSLTQTSGGIPRLASCGFHRHLFACPGYARGCVRRNICRTSSRPRNRSIVRRPCLERERAIQSAHSHTRRQSWKPCSLAGTCKNSPSLLPFLRTVLSGASTPHRLLANNIDNVRYRKAVGGRAATSQSRAHGGVDGSNITVYLVSRLARMFPPTLRRGSEIRRSWLGREWCHERVCGPAGRLAGLSRRLVALRGRAQVVLPKAPFARVGGRLLLLLVAGNIRIAARKSMQEVA